VKVAPATSELIKIRKDNLSVCRQVAEYVKTVFFPLEISPKRVYLATIKNRRKIKADLESLKLSNVSWAKFNDTQISKSNFVIHLWKSIGEISKQR
jgi:hypothetical protein